MGMQSIFTSNLINAATPQANWLFIVAFKRNGIPFTSNNADIIATKVDLPKFETTTVTKHFLGTEKTFPINRSYAGESSLEFICRKGKNEIMFANALEEGYSEYAHDEFNTYFEDFRIEMYSQIGKVECIYHLKNVIITDANLGNLSYEDENTVKLEITIHYDSWTIEIP